MNQKLFHIFNRDDNTDSEESKAIYEHASGNFGK